MTVQEALIIGSKMLAEAGIDSAGGDARRLMSANLELELGRLTLHAQDELDGIAEAVFFADVMERAEGKPVSHLLGWREFFGRRFIVGKQVLDPRPETEALVGAALSVDFTEVLDLGVGSGSILLTLLAERDAATGIGTDVSEAALSVATRNAEALGVINRCALVQSDWFEAVGGQFDLIVSNPPYIAAEEMDALQPELSFEPRVALTDEGDGLSAYRVIARDARAYLKAGGHLMVETGWQQGQAVLSLLQDAGFRNVQILCDLDGRDRVVRGLKPA